MKFKANKLAVAVAASLGVTMVGTAQADEILFPYVVASSTVTTLISTINAADVFGETVPGELHYRYYYKTPPATGNSNTVPCVETNRRLPSSANDVVTFDVSEHFGEGNLGILYEDLAATTPNYGKNTFALLKTVAANGVRAFLMVDNNDFSFGTVTDSSETVAGEAVILEFVAGAAWGYTAYNAAGRYDANGARINAFDFSDNVETAGEVIANGSVPVVIPPISTLGGQWMTSFLVTPISRTVGGAAGTPGDQRRDSTFDGVRTRNLNAKVRLSVQDPAIQTTDVMFDRDERPVSGQIAQNVLCVGSVPVTSMVSEASLQDMKNGGWSNLVVSIGSLADNAELDVIQTDEAVVMKLEYNPTAISLGTGGVTGIVNTANWLRRGIRESLPRVVSPVPRLNLYNTRGANNVGIGDLNSPVPTFSTF